MLCFYINAIGQFLTSANTCIVGQAWIHGWLYWLPDPTEKQEVKHIATLAPRQHTNTMRTQTGAGETSCAYISCLTRRGWGVQPLPPVAMCYRHSSYIIIIINKTQNQTKKQYGRMSKTTQNFFHITNKFKDGKQTNMIITQVTWVERK